MRRPKHPNDRKKGRLEARLTQLQGRRGFCRLYDRDCPWCLGNMTHFDDCRRLASDLDLTSYLNAQD